MRFNGLDFLLIEDSMFLKKISKLPESIRSMYVSNCISLNSKSLRNLLLQVHLSYKETILVTFPNTLLVLVTSNF